MLAGYTHHETLNVYRGLPMGGTLRALLLSPYLIARTLIRCRRQRRRSPWIDNAQYMNVPLNQLRSSFGIEVMHPK